MTTRSLTLAGVTLADRSLSVLAGAQLVSRGLSIGGAALSARESILSGATAFEREFDPNHILPTLDGIIDGGVAATASFLFALDGGASGSSYLVSVDGGSA